MILLGGETRAEGTPPPTSHNAFLQLLLPNTKPQPQLSLVCVCEGIITVCNFSPPTPLTPSPQPTESAPSVIFGPVYFL